MTFTIFQRIEALESKKASLESQLAKGGEYISDGYGCVEWDYYSPVYIQKLEKEINEIQTILIELYKIESYFKAKIKLTY